MTSTPEHPETENASIPLRGKEGKPPSAAALRAESDQGAAAAATSSGDYGQVWFGPADTDPHSDEAWRPLGHTLAADQFEVVDHLELRGAENTMRPQFETDGATFTMHAELPPEAAALFGLMAGSPTRDRTARYAVTIDSTEHVPARPQPPAAPPGLWANIWRSLSGRAGREREAYKAAMEAWLAEGAPATRAMRRVVHVPAAQVGSIDGRDAQ